MSKTKNKQKNEFTKKEFIIIVVIALLIWRIPPLFFDLGAIIVGLLAALGFVIGVLFILVLRKIKKHSKE